MEFHRTTLDNGLEVIAECNDEVHSAAVALFVKTGARDETDEVAGVSHFLEHMVFKGTPTRTAEEVNREFDAMGADNNAYTSKENTVYWAAVLPEYLEPATVLLADLMRPSLRGEDFDTEKQVIIEEIRMYEDQPPFGADEQCEALHFGSHPLSHRVLGTAESVGNLRVEQMRAYLDQRYSPGNIVLAAAGRLEFDALVAVARRCSAGWQPFETNRQLTAAPRHAGFHFVHKPAAVQQYTVQLAAAPADENRERYAADVLATVLGDASGSRLYWELIDSGLAEQAALYYHDYQGAGIFWTVLSCMPDQTTANLQAVLDVYRGVETEGVSAEELEQARSKTKSRIVLASERPRRRLFTVGGNWVHRGEYFSVRDELDAVEAVTLDDVHEVLRRYPPSASTTVTVGPMQSVAAPR